MKKLYVLLLTASLLFFIACGEDNPGTDEPEPVTPDPTYSDFATWSEWLEHKYGREFGGDADNWDGSPVAPITHDMLAEEYFFAKGLNAGWNLGNTYDWHANPRASNGRYDLLFAGVKEAGINVIRIPVSWSSNSSESGNAGYTKTNVNGATVEVTERWLDEVEEAIEAAHAAGLAVFINTHHDKSLFRLDLAGASLRDEGETGADFVLYTERFRSVWSQVATRFRDHGDWLMFESINEPTVTDSLGAVIWDDAPYPAVNQVLSKWNQAFIDAVRETGGNNAKRYLIFKAYGGKLVPATTSGNGFSLPVDPAGAGRLAFSFHMYMPNGLALDGSGITWTNNNAVLYRGAYANAQATFSAKGIPVFSGETSAIFQPQRTGSESVQANKNRLLLLNAIGHYAGEYGIIPCLWDNAMLRQGNNSSTPNGENHTLFQRNNNTSVDAPNTYGQPVDYTRVNFGNPNNAASDDPDYGVAVIKAYVDAISGKAELGKPEYSDKLKELMTANNISF